LTHFRKLPQFLLVGGSTFVLYIGLQTLFARLGLRPLVALTVAYLLSITFHYTANRLYTWAWHAHSLSGTVPSIARYAVMTCTSYGITLVIAKAVTAFGFDIRIGMTLSVLVTMCASYILQRFWVFSE